MGKRSQSARRPSDAGGEPHHSDRLTPLLLAAPIASALIVLILGLSAYASTRREDRAGALVAHTHAVIEINRAVLARLVDAETGERGFIITGDSSYLAPYHGAETDLSHAIDSLRRLTVDDDAQQPRIDTLASLARRRLSTLDSRVVSRIARGFEPTRADFAILGGGRAVMDSARSVSGMIETQEQSLLATRQAALTARERVTIWVVAAGTILATLLALAITVALSRAAATQTALANDVQARAQALDRLNEELAARTADAEQANRAKAEFLANMSHDLRTPLNAIIGYVDLLELGIRGPLGPEQREDVRRIKRGAAHLLALVNDVLDFAKLEAGQLTLRIEDLDLGTVLSELRPLLEPQVRSKQLEFQSHCDSGMRVRADREKLDQILVNLVGNAIKFTSSGGRVEINCRAGEEWARIEVRDTGEGIAPEQLEAVFAPFVQADRRKRPREQHGIGLGLSISRQLSRAMQGDLTVESAVGRGSTFTVRLPRRS